MYITVKMTFKFRVCSLFDIFVVQLATNYHSICYVHLMLLFDTIYYHYLDAVLDIRWCIVGIEQSYSIVRQVMSFYDPDYNNLDTNLIHYWYLVELEIRWNFQHRSPKLL